MTTRLTAVILVLATTPLWGHRLDEYLQGTILAVEKNRLQAQMILTPGVAVFPLVIADIDTDANGVVSEAEQQAYAGRVLRDLSLTIDGVRLTPRLISMRFPTTDEMQEGRGGIQLDFEADLPSGGRNRELTLENHHQRRIAAYQVNCLVPSDPHIRIAAQNRNYSQSLYKLEYEDTDVGAEAVLFGFRPARLIELSPIAVILFARLAWLWRRRGWPHDSPVTNTRPVQITHGPAGR
jgi:hypothetical protein